MSYSCSISFKKIDAKDIFDFFVAFKNSVSNHFETIAEDNYVFSPLFRCVESAFNDKQKLRELWGDTEQWAKLSVFNYRWFYNKELNLLGVYSVDKCVRDLFDKTVYFQNSCDQDYDRDDWEGIEEFENIFDKFMNMSLDELKTFASENDMSWLIDDEDMSDERIEYAKKSVAYKTIWDYFENTLYDDNSIVYLQLFAYYDIMNITNFVGHIKKFVQDWYDEFNKDKYKEEEFKELIMEQCEQG